MTVRTEPKTTESASKRPALPDQVVVITGASQGIGRETAMLVARRGAAVVAVARNDEALGTLVDGIRRAGGRAEAVSADVADPGALERAAEIAVQRFGRIDTWVNDAAVSVYAHFEEMTPDELDRVIRVNLLGQMYGCQAALRWMRSAGRGTIINVGSALSERGVQLQSAYVASKHGIAGFTEALRLELMETAPGIDVVLILPSSIDTPLFESARSKLGVLPMPIPPVYEPAAVAEAIAHAAEHGGREIVVGGAAKLLILAQRLSPTLLDRYMTQGRRLEAQQRTARPDDGRDNLFTASVGPGATRGRFGPSAKPSSLYTRILELHPARKRVLEMAGVIAGLLAIRKAGT
jgi:NAD(P)-dependent dehydrogenase (short-subunit alcohol dehydrogenase family)